MTDDLSKYVRPLEWHEFESGALVADAPLFGRIRVENLGPGDSWVVFYSVPGYSDRFMDGCFETPGEAKAAAQADYARRILAAIDADALIADGVREGLRMGAEQASHGFHPRSIIALATNPDAIAAAVARVKGGRDDG